MSTSTAILRSLPAKALTKHDEIVRDAKSPQIVEFYNENCLGDGEEPLTEDVWANLDATSKNMVKKVVTKATLTSFNEDNGQRPVHRERPLLHHQGGAAEVDAIGDETEKNEYRQAHSFSASTRSAVETVQRKYGSVKATADSDTLTYTQASTLQRELYSIEMYGQVSEIDPTASAYSLQQSDKDNMAELNDKLEFLGIPLGKDPASDLGWPMILIPILAFVFSMAQTLISMKTMDTSAAGGNSGCLKATFFIMPIFSIVLVFTVPARRGLLLDDKLCVRYPANIAAQ